MAGSEFEIPPNARSAHTELVKHLTVLNDITALREKRAALCLDLSSRIQFQKECCFGAYRCLLEEGVLNKLPAESSDLRRRR